MALTEAEHQVFPDLNADTFIALGHVAFNGPGGQLVRLDPAEACP